MSKFIDLVETFDLSTLEYKDYCDKIDGLLKRFPQFENDKRFRTVLPDKFNQNANDYISMKFCTIGRRPVYGIYNRRDLDLVGVCVDGNIMYALDDCDLHPSFVPDLNVRKLYLGIRYTPLATRETLNYAKKCMCSAISTLSLGYTPQKKNEWCEAIVLLTGMTSQAVRFCIMKEHVGLGLHCINAHNKFSFHGRYEFSCGNTAMHYRWNKISKAIRRGEYPYIYSYYNDSGTYCTTAMCEFSAQRKVSLINSKDKTKTEKIRKRIDKWNGPLGNSIRKREEEFHRRRFMEREARRIMEKMNGKSSDRMHGFWFGSVDTFKSKVACVKCLQRPDQMVSANGFLRSATSHLVRIEDVLQARRIIASVLVAVKSIWREVGLLACFRGTTTSMILENWRSDLYIWFERPKPNPCKVIGAATHRAIVDCTRPVFSASAFFLSAKHHGVSTSTKDLSFGQFGISEVNIDRKKVNWSQEPRLSVQQGYAGFYRAPGATCICPLQDVTRMHVQTQHPNTNAGLSGFYKGLVLNLLGVVSSRRVAPKLKTTILLCR